MRARDGLNRLYNIEVQVRDQESYIERSLFYLSKLYSEQVERGGDYDQLHRTVAISILDFTLFPRIDDLHSRFRFHDAAHDLELSDILEIHYLELTKFGRDQPLRTPLEKWLHMLKFADTYRQGLGELPGPIRCEEEILMAFDAMNHAYAREDVRELIEERLRAEWDENTRLKHARKKGLAEGVALGKAEGVALGKAEGVALGKAEGVALGKAEGLTEAKAETARQLAALGVDADVIFQATGISVDGPESGQQGP